MKEISNKKTIEIVSVVVAALTVLTGAVNAEPSHIVDTTAAISSVVVFSESFESGWNGWYADNGVWEVGNSTVVNCYGGSNCAATVLNGNYPPVTASRLISPSIQLPVVSAGEEIHLRFWQWFSYVYNSNGYDNGKVQISVYNASTNTWDGFQNVGNSVYGSSPYWSLADRDITQYAGKKIRIAFYHVDENFWASGQSTGWYIDDVEITGVTLPPTVSIITDNSQYFAGDTMKVTYTIVNPTSNTMNFEWYIGAPQKNKWVTYMKKSIPAGNISTQTVSIPVSNWGTTPFGLINYVHLLNSSTGKVLAQDAVLCIYSPTGGMASISQVDFEDEIMKTK